MLCWLSVLLASLSWIFAFRHYVPENRHVQWGLIAAALLTGIIGFREGARGFRFRGRYLWLLIPCCLALALALPGYRPAVGVFLAAGLIPLVIASRWAGLQPVRLVGFAGLILGAILIVQSPVYWLVTSWTARNPQVPFVAPVIYGLLKWVGADASVHGSSLFIRTMQDVHEFPVTWGHLALFPLLVIWVGGSALAWWHRAQHSLLKRLTALTAILMGYAILRLFLVMALFIYAMLVEEYGSETVHVELFWTPWITALTLLPLAPILGRLLPWKVRGLGETAPWTRPWFSLARIGIASTACLGLVLACRFPDPGLPKQGRLLMDEAHSQWERSDKAYDTDWYGGESEYNYYCMARYLEHFFDLETNMHGSLSPEKLAGCDVLILKNPTKPYAEEEIDAIEAFVQNGGGLFMAGEHTDVFGTSTCLNAVGRRFGITFRPDGVFDIERKWEQMYFPEPRGAHPIVQNVPFYRFAVTCSIETSTWAMRPIMRGTGLWTLPIEFAASNFYPQVVDHTYARFGAFDQMVSSTHGRGRVVAFSDSTVYSNFLAFYPGKPEVLVNSCAWLNRMNRLNWISTLGFAVFVAGFLLTALLSLRSNHCMGFSAALLATVAATAWAGLLLCQVLGSSWYPDPTPVKPLPSVTVDMEHSTCELPIFGFTQKHEESYQVFYQWVLRVGYYPKASFNLRRALAAGGPVVIVKPTRRFSEKTLRSIRTALEKGACVLLLDAPRIKTSQSDTSSSSNEILNAFGLSLSAEPCRGTQIVEPTSGAQICRLSRGQVVHGGEPLLVTDKGDPILARTAVGRGWLVAAGFAERFTNRNMGHTTRRIPDRALRAVYELQFALLRGLVQGDLPEQLQNLGKTYSD